MDRDDNRVVQAMTLGVNGSVIQKGVKAILEERGLFNGERFECKLCKNPRGGDLTPKCLTKTCCARVILANQPDFLEQMEWLEETIIRAGHRVLFFPAFHCELNYIERVWSYTKVHLRRICSYSFADLEMNLPTTLDTVPVATIRRYYRSCSRCMDLYRHGLHGPLLDFAMKKYTSHRRVPENGD